MTNPPDFEVTAGGAIYNLLKTPAQPMLVIGDEGLLKELSGKVRPKPKKKPDVARRNQT